MAHGQLKCMNRKCYVIASLVFQEKDCFQHSTVISLLICLCGLLVDADEYNAYDDQEGACN
jgi:hypothetical protein